MEGARKLHALYMKMLHLDINNTKIEFCPLYIMQNSQPSKQLLHKALPHAIILSQVCMVITHVVKIIGFDY